MQEEIIRAVLDGQDTLAILPTGGGKSICFQVPAMASPGICLVISPLIALMKDQVENLKKKEIPALLIHSGMKRADVVRTLQNATDPYFKFLYLSPERLETSLFQEYLPSIDVNLIAVDESHCISQWGYDFRPSYLRIAALRESLPRVPVLALTASATPVVQEDIMARLSFTRHRVFRQSFERKNLSYSAFHVSAKGARLVDIIQKVEGTAIVYCKSRRRTTEIAQLLQMNGISAGFYHAGLDADTRSERQKDWIENRTRVMVCTNAFGMGIDKPDVRLVVHADVPDCLENYYQEAGRAGRDGKKSYAVLLFDERDKTELEALHLVRFPTMEYIRSVYKAMVNFLQIPSYTGEYQSFNFPFETFTSNFRLKSNEALYALKALESDGWINYNERSFAPSTVLFTCTREELSSFQEANAKEGALLTTLLRSYTGILDFPASVSEKLMAKLLRLPEADIKKQLLRCAAQGIIRYTPQNESPQVFFLKHRVPAEELTIRMAEYNKRRQSFIERVEKMIAYTTTTGCRSEAINSYFGESTGRDCGTCDNCLRKKAGELHNAGFDRYSRFILERLHAAPLTPEALLASLGRISREKAMEVIRYLQSENRIRTDADGRLMLNGKYEPPGGTTTAS